MIYQILMMYKSLPLVVDKINYWLSLCSLFKMKVVEPLCMTNPIGGKQIHMYSLLQV